MFKIIDSIDYMNYDKFLNLMIMIVLDILITNCIFNMFEHKVKNVHLIDQQLLGILNYHN